MLLGPRVCSETPHRPIKCSVAIGNSHSLFERPDRVRVGDELLAAPRVFINVGARASVSDMPGVDEVPFLNNRSMLELDRLPDSATWFILAGD